MRSISLRAWLLVALSAALQIFMFPTGGPMPTWRAAICWFALVPFLCALLVPGKDGMALSLRNSLTLGYLCGFLWYFGNCFWIYQTMYIYGGLPKPVSFGIVVLFSLYLGLYHALFAGLFSAVRRGRGRVSAALALTPFLWVAVELARGRITGFPWDLLGNVLVDNQIVTRIAPVAGVMGISFLAASANAGLAASLIGGGKRRWLGAVCVAVGVAILAFAGKPGPAELYPEATHAYATLLQENLSVGAMGKEDHPVPLSEELDSFSKASLAPLFASQGREGEIGITSARVEAPALIVWPEAPSHLRSDDPYFRSRVGQLARTAGVPVITGSLGVDLDASSARGYFLYDSASLFTADGAYSGRYDKIHLVPWGEYVPFKQLFSFAEKLTEGVGNMDPGHERKVFTTGGHSYGIFVCYESIFGDEVRQFVNNGAEVLVNISDDGWYGETGAPWQHLNMARMRAIENHRWVLRSTNTGVTTSIDPWGRVAIEAPRHVRAGFAFPFSFEQGTTFYTRHDDWFAYLCALVTVLAVGARWRFSAQFEKRRLG